MQLSRESTRQRAIVDAGHGKVELSYHEAGTGSGVGGGLPLVMLHGGGPGASS